MGKTIHVCATLVSFLALGVQSASAGSSIRLSDFSSDQTSADDLDATLEFSVTGSTLTLIVTNDTPNGTGFDISDIFFNAPPSVTGISLSSPMDGWVIALDERADGFGTFDFALLSDQGHHDPGEISPQGTLEFELEISGTGPFDNSDFTTQFSTIPPGNRPSLAAVKFVNGPHDDSAYGAVIPEPSTVSLLLLGLGLLARRSSHSAQ
jgi:hypothetical protein